MRFFVLLSGQIISVMAEGDKFSPCLLEDVGWETHYDEGTGQNFYYHPETGGKTWDHPILSAGSASGEPLPEGWAIHHTPDGTKYYHHTETGRTTYEQPSQQILGDEGSIVITQQVDLEIDKEKMNQRDAREFAAQKLVKERRPFAIDTCKNLFERHKVSIQFMESGVDEENFPDVDKEHQYQQLHAGAMSGHQLNCEAKDITRRFLKKVPQFSFLLHLGALKKGKGRFFRAWGFFGPFLFVLCIAVCLWRLFVPGPAHYNSFTNGAMVFLHLWLIFAYFKVRHIILEDGGLNVWNELNVEGRISVKCIEHTHLITIQTILCVVVVTIVVLAGWNDDFYSSYYRESENPILKVYGYLSFGAFALIVIPWLAAIFSIKGIVEIILLTQRWKVKQFTKFVFNSFKDDHHFKMNACFYDCDDDDDNWDIAKHGNRKDPIQLFVNSFLNAPNSELPGSAIKVIGQLSKKFQDDLNNFEFIAHRLSRSRKGRRWKEKSSKSRRKLGASSKDLTATQFSIETPEKDLDMWTATESIDQLWQEAVGKTKKATLEKLRLEKIAKKLWIKKKEAVYTGKNGPKECIFTDYPGIAWHSFKGTLPKAVKEAFGDEWKLIFLKAFGTTETIHLKAHVKWTIDQLAQFIYIFKVHAADICQVDKELPEGGNLPTFMLYSHAAKRKSKSTFEALGFHHVFGKSSGHAIGDDYLHSSDPRDIKEGQILKGNMTVECLHDGDVLAQVHPYVQHHSNVMYKVFEFAKSNIDSCGVQLQNTDDHDDEFNDCREKMKEAIRGSKKKDHDGSILHRIAEIVYPEKKENSVEKDFQRGLSWVEYKETHDWPESWREQIAYSYFADYFVDAADFREDTFFRIRQQSSDSFRAQLRNLKDDISRTSRALEDIIGSLIFVGLALIIGPLVGLYIYFQKNEDLRQGFHFHGEGQLLGPFHYYLRDLFDMLFGIYAILMAIIDTGQLSDDCDKCIKTVSLLKLE